MKKQMNRALGGVLFILGGAGACSAEDRAPGGGRVEHPEEPGAQVAPSAVKAPPPPTVAVQPTASAVPTPAPPVDPPLAPSEEFEKRWGIKLSPVDKAIMDDCPPRAWSKNVPKRRCTRDNECGDGFCDRERCAPLWTCRVELSRPCEKSDHCYGSPCIEGRCRSCASDSECETLRRVTPATCSPDTDIPGFRRCLGAPSILPPAPPTKTP
jgi:hypothetical protein